MKMKNKKQNVFHFPFFYENKKRMRALKIQSKNFIKRESNSQLFEFHFSSWGKNKTF